MYVVTLSNGFIFTTDYSYRITDTASDFSVNDLETILCMILSDIVKQEKFETYLKNNIDFENQILNIYTIEELIDENRKNISDYYKEIFAKMFLDKETICFYVKNYLDDIESVYIKSIECLDY